MESYYSNSPATVAKMNTGELREHFLIPELFVPGEVHDAYLHDDRICVLGVTPTTGPLTLPAPKQIAADHFFQRREAGVINVGGPGHIHTDEDEFDVPHTGVVYIGKGTKDVTFTSDDPHNPAAFYVFSALSHVELPSQQVTETDMNVLELGDDKQANRRTLRQCIVEDGVASAQIAFGFTTVHQGNTWNTMPPHTHDRRTEVYMYFDMADEDRVFHFMGQPEETRHLIVANREVVVSPSWSVHFGAGTGPYTFVWATAGENASWGDMDHLTASELC